jgi:hypothetical protein
MKEQNAIYLATQLGRKVTFHERSGTTQIDGHHWERWLVLRNVPDPEPLVIWRGGVSRVCEGEHAIH